MSQTVEFDLKQMVLFERHVRPARSPADAGGHRPRLLAVRRPPRRGGRIAEPRGPHARPAASGWASACICWAGTIGRSRRSSRPTAARWPTSTWPSATSPGRSTTRRSRATRPPRRPATTPATAPWAGPSRCATPATPQAALAALDRLSGAIEQTAEYLAQRAATVAGHRRQSARSRRPVRAGRRGRSQSSRRPVRPGPGKRPPRQRRHGDGAVQAGRRAVSRRTSARC